MSQNVIYIGVDVDDVRYHGSALDQCTGEVLDFQCRPTLKGLVGQLEKVQEYPWVAQRQRRIVLDARLLVASGTIERDGEVVHLVAGRLEDHSRLLGKLETRSRDFS